MIDFLFRSERVLRNNEVNVMYNKYLIEFLCALEPVLPNNEVNAMNNKCMIELFTSANCMEE